MVPYFVYPFLVIVCLLEAGCRPAPEAVTYEIRGQIISIQSEKNELTITHEEVPGFMPAMTMPFAVEDVRLLMGRKPGEFIEATLVVTKRKAFLSRIEATGFANLSDPAGTADGFTMGKVVRAQEPVQDAEFLDQDHRRIGLTAFQGQYIVLTFIYTRCPMPTFCPLMDRHFATLQQAIQANDTLSARVHLISVTFDPQYDRPAILKEHAQRVGADNRFWTFLTGDELAITNFSEQFGIWVALDKENTSDITHNLCTALVDRSGRLIRIYRGNEWTPEQLLTDLKSAMGSE